MSSHSRTHPDHLDQTAGHMRRTAGEVESASGSFDAHIAGASYGGGTTAELIQGVVGGVGGAVGGGPRGAGGVIAQHNHDYADNLNRHAANSRENEAAISEDMDRRTQALNARTAARPPAPPGGDGTGASAPSRISQALDGSGASSENPELDKLIPDAPV